MVYVTIFIPLMFKFITLIYLDLLLFWFFKKEVKREKDTTSTGVWLGKPSEARLLAVLALFLYSFINVSRSNILKYALR